MKIKNLLVVTLGILSFIGAIWLEKAIAISGSYPDPKQQSQPTEIVQAQGPAEITLAASEETAEQLYQAGRLQEAIALLQQLANNYASQGDELGQARVYRNLALIYYQVGDAGKANEAITSSLNHLQKESNYKAQKQILAEILEVKGVLQLSLGESEEALASWKEATDIYQRLGDTLGTTKNQINQAQALQRMGLYRQAIKTLNDLNVNLQQQPDSILKVKGLQSLGDALRVAGELERSQEVLAQSLAIAEKLADANSIASNLLSLGNTARWQKKFTAAFDYYQRAAKSSSLLNFQVPAQLNQISLLVEQKKWSDALQMLPQAQANFSKLPVNINSIYVRLNLANSLLKIVDSGENKSINYGDILPLLTTTVQQAKTLKNQRILSYSVGYLGRIYRRTQQWNYAKELTEKALLLSQGINASDISYRWQWQLGRILNQQGKRADAIAAYTESVNTLQSIRADLVAINSEAQFSFQESIEPVYRELVDLLLPIGEEVAQSDLKRARDVIDSLQLAELDNFFRDACLKTQAIAIDKIDPKAAVFSTIILSDRLEVIVALPGQNLRRYTNLLPQTEIEATITAARNALIIPRQQLSVKKFLVPSQKIYNWLIRPLETDLAKSGIETLVFVLDGSLRNIPMSALYDGDKYLLEKYSIALAPSLKLVDAKPLEQGKLEVLAAGLSESRQGFSALPGVSDELAKIVTEIPSEQLLNQSFTTVNLKRKFKSSSFPVVHLATHGQFSSQASNTFILTWDDRINAKAFDSLLRSDTRESRAIELLVLSACQTAAGDNRATLGLTGIAMRAGARSTIASLWSVNDEATSLLMAQFYEELANLKVNSGKVTKAEALRRAELTILRKEGFSHPYFWSGFVLVGNWL